MFTAIYRSKGYQVFDTCVCVIMGIVWINVCNWLSTCCLIVTSLGMLFYECDLLGRLVGIMKQYLKNETCLFHLVFCHLMSPLLPSTVVLARMMKRVSETMLVGSSSRVVMVGVTHRPQALQHLLHDIDMGY